MPGPQILVIEDEGIAALELQARLRDLGYEVPSVVATGEAALQQLDHHLPDVVLMDLRLPGAIDGVAVADEIRRRYRVPVVFLTAYTDDETMQRASLAQPYGLVPRPFDAAHLRATIEMALYRHQADRRSYEQQLRDARALEQRMQRHRLESLGMLAGGVAHDFNNLLAVIVAATSLALLDHSAPSPTHESLVAIREAAERATELAGQMLAYSGKGRLLAEIVDLNRLLTELSTGDERLVPHSIALTIRLAAHLPPIIADATQLKRVVRHLVLNAVEAIGAEEGAVTLTTSLHELDAVAAAHLASELMPGTYVAIEVADTGHGMDQATRERVFEPFFSTKFAGRGLSLAEVLGVVVGHQGAIQVASEPGRGAWFRVLLPTAPEVLRRQPATSPGIAPAPPQGDGGLVLVVDDEPGVRAVMSRVLQRAGYRVLLADDGQSGVEVFAQHADAIDCVLLDLTMPRMGGREALIAIRSQRPDVRVLLMSGYSEHDLAERFSGLALSGLLQKPFTPAVLVERVSAAMQRSANG